MKTKLRHLAPAVLGLTLLAGMLVPTAAQAATPKTATYQTYTANGVTSQYHIYANNIDTSKPVGVVFWFSGDYWTKNQTDVYNPNGTVMKRMAAEAAKKNMILVPVISPDKNAGGDGITWWEDMDRNGDYFRSLAANLISKYNLDASRINFAGYSGGAEFITYEVLADRSGWIKGGSATIIGGGGANRMQTTPSAVVKKMNLTWFSGSRDVAGVTNPPTWSALNAAKQGEKLYRAAGFTNTKLTVLQGLDHYQYDHPALVATSLKSMPAAALPAPNSKAVIKKGDVAAIDSKGNLYAYSSAKGKNMSSRTYVSAGWSNAKHIDITDWNSDGRQDIVANWSDGKLTVDYGQANGGFSRSTIGRSGWSNYDITTAKWKQGEKYPSIIAKDKATGKLYVYGNPSGKAHGSRVLIGSSGWSKLSLMATDFDKDGKMDIIAKTTQGQLKLYRSNGAGKFVSENRKVIGKSGWNAMSQVSTIQNHLGNGNDGILAKDKKGKLHHYAMTKNKINSRTTIGTGGWTTYKVGS